MRTEGTAGSVTKQNNHETIARKLRPLYPCLAPDCPEFMKDREIIYSPMKVGNPVCFFIFSKAVLPNCLLMRVLYTVVNAGKAKIRAPLKYEYTPLIAI